MPISPQARHKLKPRARTKDSCSSQPSGLTIFCIDLLQNFHVQRWFGQQLFMWLFSNSRAFNRLTSAASIFPKCLHQA